MKYWNHIYYFPVIGIWGNLSSGVEERSTAWSFQTILGLSQAEMIHTHVAGFHSDCCAALLWEISEGKKVPRCKFHRR